MKTRTLSTTLDASSLGTLSELLDLLAKLSELNEPLNTADGLHSAIALLVQAGSVIGIDADVLSWLNGALDDPAVFNLILAIVGYVMSLIEPTSPTSANKAVQKSACLAVQAIPIAVWFSVISEIAQLLQKLLAKQ